MPYNANQHEQEILQFWSEDKTFEKSIAQRPENKPYVFYDGPPFATGLPHYGHILSSVIKDVIPRYWTMKGYRVRRRWGWDCHGLPIESLIEKELQISGKKQIEAMGVGIFNEACKSKVLLYTKEWKKMVDREGRWVEFDNAYKTMDATYMESVWWSLKTIWDKGLIYEGRKVLMYCPRCETPVSKAEISMDNSYKDVTEETVTVKFKIKNNDQAKTLGLSENTFVLAWTTTPWTLPGNVALAVGNDIEYALVKCNDEYSVVAKNLIEKLFGGKNFSIEKEIKGTELIGLEYEPLFDMPAMLATNKKAYYITAGDFVTTEEGTGVVHTAVIYGEDDFNLGLKLDLPMVPMLDSMGIFTDVASEFLRGIYFKKAEKEIKNNLDNRGLLFNRQQYTHSYPHCWRCDTQLFYNAISAWFINIQTIKARLLELNEKINWHPDHLKHGRFLNILETAPDWNISRNRYWATPLPFWKCVVNETHVSCIGSLAELKERALNFSAVFKTENVAELDLHKQYADQIILRCDQCVHSTGSGQDSEMKRIPEVIDCWVESASMPFAEFHYPFENKDVFEARFPGQFIGEYIAQTRAWFYYMHTMAVLLFDNVSFENVACTGTILNEKGEKLSKSKQNYTDPWIIIEQYGMDALRFYLMTSVVMDADNLYFNDREVRDVYNRVVNILWNVTEFLEPYQAEQNIDIKAVDSKYILDQWILAKLYVLIRDTTQEMDAYNTVKAGRAIRDFIDELSTWYLRRSRDRFKSDNTEDRQAAIATLNYVLLTLAKIMAPFTPFIAEEIYLKLIPRLVPIKSELPQGKPLDEHSSVHLEMWPKVDESLIDEKVLAEMDVARKVVELGLSLRAEAGIKVRQVLGNFVMSVNLSDDLRTIIAEELNVKNVRISTAATNYLTKIDGSISVALDTIITQELQTEGLAREIVRTINQMRKEQGLSIHDKVAVHFATADSILLSVINNFGMEICRSVLARELKADVLEEPDIAVDGHFIKINLVLI